MTGSRLAEQLVAHAETLDELLGTSTGIMSAADPSFGIAVATTVGILRATAAVIRDEHPDDEPGSSSGGFLDEQIERVSRAYRDGIADGWISCLAAHGITPDDPDDPASLESAGAFTPRPDRHPITGEPVPPPTDWRRLITQVTPRRPTPGGGS